MAHATTPLRVKVKDVKQLQTAHIILFVLVVACWLSVTRKEGSLVSQFTNSSPAVEFNEWDKEQWERYPDVNAEEQKCIEPGADATFSEWIRWHAVNVYGKGYARYVDKAAVKHFVRLKTPTVKLPQTLAVFDSENLHTLPSFNFPASFAFKAVHGSRMNILVINNTINGKPYTAQDLMDAAKPWLRRCYRCELEHQYSNIHKSVVVEEFIGTSQPVDYKLYVFNEEVFIVQVKTNEKDGAKFVHYYRNWQPMPKDARKDLVLGKPRPKPAEMDAMYEYARILTKGFRFLRLDMYIMDGEIYFGEMTFSPGNGMRSMNSFVGELKAAIGLCDFEAKYNYRTLLSRFDDKTYFDI